MSRPAPASDHAGCGRPAGTASGPSSPRPAASSQACRARCPRVLESLHNRGADRRGGSPRTPGCPARRVQARNVEAVLPAAHAACQRTDVLAARGALSQHARCFACRVGGELPDSPELFHLRRPLERSSTRSTIPARAPSAWNDRTMVLSDRSIREALTAGRIVIDPFDPELVQPSSVDVRCDHRFRVFHPGRYPFIDVKQPMPDLTELVEIADGRAFTPSPRRIRPGRDAGANQPPRRPRRETRRQELPRPPGRTSTRRQAWRTRASPARSRSSSRT